MPKLENEQHERLIMLEIYLTAFVAAAASLAMVLWGSKYLRRKRLGKILSRSHMEEFHGEAVKALVQVVFGSKTKKSASFQTSEEILVGVNYLPSKNEKRKEAVLVIEITAKPKNDFAFPILGTFMLHILRNNNLKIEVNPGPLSVYLMCSGEPIGLRYEDYETSFSNFLDHDYGTSLTLTFSGASEAGNTRMFGDQRLPKKHP